MSKQEIEAIDIQGYCTKGKNDIVFEEAKKHLKKNSRILVLASGEGALEKVLLLNGYTNITSVELYSDFKLKDYAKHLTIDFNTTDFHKQIQKQSHKEYDMIFAVEIIEHLHSPYAFLENIQKLLAKKGHCIVTTPNPSSFLARVDAVLTGYPSYFVAPPKIPGDHISPIYPSIFRYFATQNKMTVIKSRQLHSQIKKIFSHKIFSLRSVIFMGMRALLIVLLQPVMLVNRRIGHGTGQLFVLKNNQKK